MKKTTAIKGLVAASVLVFSIVNVSIIMAFYQALVPASSMVGQEIWLVMALFVAHYIGLALYVSRFITLVVKRINYMTK